MYGNSPQRKTPRDLEGEVGLQEWMVPVMMAMEPLEKVPEEPLAVKQGSTLITILRTYDSIHEIKSEIHRVHNQSSSHLRRVWS